MVLKGKNKYNNIKTIVYGKKFDSKKEANRYLILKSLENEYKINDLQTQVAFPLVKKSKYGREIKYVADFVYYENGKMIVEDTKSPITRKNRVYQIKKRLMAEIYDIEIKES